MSNKRYTSMDSLQFLLSKPSIKTFAMNKIHRVLNDAQTKSQMVGIIGREGIGKTTASAIFTIANKNVYYIRMGQSYGGKTLFHELLYLLTGKEIYASTNMNSTINYLSSILNDQPEKKLIIIDDAGKLKSVGLGLFHELRENTQSSTGFVFLGLQYFVDNLFEWKKQGITGIAEFHRRVNFWYSLQGLTEQEKLLYLKERKLLLSSELKEVLKKADTISELETEINIYLERVKLKKQNEKGLLEIVG